MARIWFLFASLALFLTAVLTDDKPSPWTVDENSRKLQFVLDTLWESFKPEIQNKDNILIFGISSTIDALIIFNSLNVHGQKNVERLVPAFKKSQEEFQFKSIDDAESIREFSNEMAFTIVIYFVVEEYDKRKTVDLFNFCKKITIYALPNPALKGISPASVNDGTYTDLRQGLLQMAKFHGLNATCLDGNCLAQKILSSKPPMAIFTMGMWNIASDTGFQWSENLVFDISETIQPIIRTARSVAEYDYAEFQYPKIENCTGRVLRLPYKKNFNLFFVIPSSGEMCSSSDDLWMNVQHVNLVNLTYKTQPMFVSIPFFNASAHIDLRVKLKDTGLAWVFSGKSSKFDGALYMESMEVAFNPDVPYKDEPIPTITADTPEFLAERPFFFALFHQQVQQPFIAGLVNKPGCANNCGQIQK